MIIGIRNAELVEKLGRLNMAPFDRNQQIASLVFKEHPSVIDDPTIKSDFYGAPALCIIFSEKKLPFQHPRRFLLRRNAVNGSL